MAQTTIAIICDCDDTLAPDTTAQLLRAHGIDVEEFYVKLVGELVNQGHDPSVAYLNQILSTLPDLTYDRIREVGAGLELYPGVPDIFRELEQEVRDTYYDQGIRVQEFVISGGIKDLIEASSLGPVIDKIWGCNFAYDSNGRISRIKNVVSFTEKTRFLFNIQKGLTSTEHDCMPYAVNMYIEPPLIPFKNMIYLGDGPSDIPCMSIVDRRGERWGHAIGILSERQPSKTWALTYGRRAGYTVPPDFTKEAKWAWNQIRDSVMQIANRIKQEIEREREGPYPGY